MDLLRAEIAAKKRKTASLGEDANTDEVESTRKFVRRGEDDRRREEENRTRELEKRAAKVKHLREDEGRGAHSNTLDNASSSEKHRGDVVSAAERETFNISTSEAIRRLRSKGEPIRLFGESDKERRLRLRALELIEGKGEKMGQNDFMRALRGAESSMIDQDLRGGKEKEKKRDDENQENRVELRKKETGESGKVREGVGMNSLLELDLVKKDINKVYPIIYYTLKGLLKDWEQTLAERPLEIRQSNQGKLVAATQVQSADYLKPLFKQLRQRSVLPDVLARLAEIVHYVQKREYRNANDSYLQLSIGNAPWPIGVTMVGIHERSGREKIFSSNVAHVLNDEVSRKYIQSLKRLMTFSQTRYPPYLPSMLMG
ncbi:hypothetical protein CBS101457_000445 [Exobasidium rhododendri]|nr:hypothetical protein CBS101457_000445 [Exobasidium rhododendri]